MKHPELDFLLDQYLAQAEVVDAERGKLADIARKMWPMIGSNAVTTEKFRITHTLKGLSVEVL